MAIEVRKEGNVIVVDISGRMTIGKADVDLREKFADLLEAGERSFVFDMTQVSYIDSAGVGETVACQKRVREKDGIIRLVMPQQGKVREIFVIAYLDRAFEIFEDQKTALAAFS
jgi:anti-sigma B factor antagonist